MVLKYLIKIHPPVYIREREVDILEAFERGGGVPAKQCSSKFFLWSL